MVKTIGIVGLGLIGGSLGRRLVSSGCHVLAWNHNSRPYAEAESYGIDCLPSVKLLAQAKPDLLVLCNPLDTMSDVLDQLEPHFDPASTTLTDVGSVKALVHEQVRNSRLESAYVGAHPMTGTENSGFASSDPSLFDNALWAVSVDDATELSRFLLLAKVITGLLDNRLIVLGDESHDAAAALISHMPHAVSTALINELCASPQHNIAMSMAAGSWRDMTRVSLTDPNRTRAMIDENADNVEFLLRDMSERLSSFADAIHDGDQRKIKDFFSQGEAFRQAKAVMKNSDLPSTGTCAALPIDVDDWQNVLKRSSLAGQQIIGFSGDREAMVLTGHGL